VLINFNCGHDPHWVRPGDYKIGVKCPKCSGSCPKQAEEEFIALLTKNNHKSLSNYVNATTKVLINFNCGHDPHWICPASYKIGVRCPKCYGNCSKQAREEFIALLTKNNHKSLSKYVNNTTKVLINFNCGHDPHWVRPGDYKIGVRCPNCKVSKGEKVILDYLTENEFNVVSQYRIDGYNYKYDIYIREYNLIVEVHGRQHYEEVDFFGGRTLEEERMNDYEKEKLAVSKGYNYMVVDYKEHKPELALERFKEQFRFYETKQPKLEVFL
jgi:very-short-patch-repair endonuclease